MRVTDVPDPTIQEPTDAIIKITSTGLCGSDLHLYETLAPFMEAGDVVGHEPMGIVQEVGPAVTALKPGDRVVVPFNVCCGSCWMCERQALQPVRDHAEPRARHRSELLRLQQGSTARSPADRRSTCGSPSPTSCRSRCRTSTTTTGSCSSPTCCRPPGRRCSTPTYRTAGRCSSSAPARSATWRPGWACAGATG
ncbi:alcohol dehydrogenase catalytic domain-containing protein [Nocardioides convexus]|uniref:alcohol dehydrogenase catalytic domain-containing protein n=1 Tax=Nocardioides convexus TaxID=2712224 RepID=UPI0031014871